MERIDKIIAHMGQYSRSEVKALIRKGQIAVNGKLVKKEDEKVDPSCDQISIGAQPFVYQEYTYIMLYKPSGVLTATEDKKDKTVLDLLPKSARVQDLSPVGRLDKDTEGLLLLTNDGVMAHTLLSPKHHVDKTYYVEVSGEFVKQDIHEVENGIHMHNGEIFLGGKLDIIDVHCAYITIQEGKFHQVKKMMVALNKEVTYLKRISMGPLQLDVQLSPGEFRYLFESEIQELKRCANQVVR